MKLLAIDGNSLLNRAFFAVKGLSRSDGFSTNAIFGFYNTIDKILKEDEFSHLVAAFDLKAPTFRHKKYDKYKANRKKMPDELFFQLEPVKTLLRLLGVNICEIESFEADDILGTLSSLFSSKGVYSVLATGDRDCFQLINKWVVVRLSCTKEAIYYDEDKIFETFGITPKNLVEVKALMGDSSDNIPGVRGIGEKTALKLIRQFGSVENIFDNLEELQISGRVKRILCEKNAKHMCMLSKSLGKIRLDAPIDMNIDCYKRKEIKYEELIKFFKKYELNKFLDSFLKENKISSYVDIKKNNFNIIKNPFCETVIKSLGETKYLDFYMRDEILYIFGKNKIFEFTKEFVKTAFCRIISVSVMNKRTTNLKEVYNYCYRENLQLTNVVFSCDIAAYLLDSLEGDFSIESLLIKYSFGVSLPNAFRYILDVLDKEIKKSGLKFLFEKVELPLCKILSEMETIGINIDEKELLKFGVDLKKEIESLKTEIYEKTGEIFNINSTKELSAVLFEKLKLKKGRKTKTGYSTDIEVLEKLVKYSPVVSKIIEYREKTKLISTYIFGLKKLIKDDGRIHSHFNQTKTRTGRISSNEPNIQNIPIKTELGAKIRRFFTAKKNKVLIDADYSQIELRILASLSGDENMILAFCRGDDIHSITAKNIFGFVSKETRNRAKIINFSVIYGVSSFSLAKDIGVSVIQAKNYIDSFFKLYFKVSEYFEKLLEDALKSKTVSTLFGRKRYVPQLFSGNKKIYELGKRIVKNTPIQGTAADIIKIAMVNVSKKLKEEKLDANLVLQVHDELLIEVNEKDKEMAASILKQEMESVFSLKVPLICKVGIGENWLEAKKASESF